LNRQLEYDRVHQELKKKQKKYVELINNYDWDHFLDNNDRPVKFNVPIMPHEIYGGALPPFYSSILPNAKSKYNKQLNKLEKLLRKIKSGKHLDDITTIDINFQLYKVAAARRRYYERKYNNKKTIKVKKLFSRKNRLEADRPSKTIQVKKFSPEKNIPKQLGHEKLYK